MEETEEIISNRKIDLCPKLADLFADYSVPGVLQENCPYCNDFILFCCSCNNRRLSLSESERSTICCHHFRIVFTDGACANNGRPEARAGAGVAYGDREECQMSIPITDLMDKFPLRSNQRAELFAAKMGLQFLAEADEMKSTALKGDSKSWIVATDSEYVVKGITEWLPTWKVYVILMKTSRESF